MNDSKMGLFFQTTDDHTNDLYYQQVYIQDELDHFHQLKNQFIIEEHYFNHATIVEVKKELNSYTRLLQQAQELVHYINKFYLIKHKKLVDSIVLDFIKDYATQEYVCLQIKMATIKDYNKDDLIENTLDN